MASIKFQAIYLTAAQVQIERATCDVVYKCIVNCIHCDFQITY
ncbi:hypothetical protein ABNIH4_05679 [Acinetobacter baumannii ABNIH4]|nr:hypothetical protein ABNIH4_05679 [Acinetobacter baumannii ABNIH4]